LRGRGNGRNSENPPGLVTSLWGILAVFAMFRGLLAEYEPLGRAVQRFGNEESFW